jgi:putative lipoic acid-binding regulatory protein
LWGETAVLFDDKHKPQIDYPCSWEYKVIGNDEFALRQAVAEVMADVEYEVSFSHFSRTGKYCSLSVELTVVDEEQRRSLFAALKQHDDILLVL